MVQNQNNESQNTDQIVIWFDAEQLSEVAKGQRCVRFQTEIWEVMCWSQVAALAGEKTKLIYLRVFYRRRFDM